MKIEKYNECSMNQLSDQITKKDYLSAFGRKTIGTLALLLIISILGNLIQVMVISNMWSKYANTDRLTVVKLDPQGSWSVEYYSDDDVEMFQSTLRAVLFQHVERCYSKKKTVILTEWKICANMLESELQDKFLNFYEENQDGSYKPAFEVASEFNKSFKPDYIVKPYDWDIIGHVPNIKPNTDQIYNAVIFADVNKKSDNPKKTRINIKFRFVGKTAMKKFGEMINYNPIGIQIVDQKILEESK